MHAEGPESLKEVWRRPSNLLLLMNKAEREVSEREGPGGPQGRYSSPDWKYVPERSLEGPCAPGTPLERRVLEPGSWKGRGFSRVAEAAPRRPFEAPQGS